MLRGKKEILLRVATLKQQKRDLRDEFNKAVLADQETQQIEAMLVAAENNRRLLGCGQVLAKQQLTCCRECLLAQMACYRPRHNEAGRWQTRHCACRGKGKQFRGAIGGTQ